MIEIGLLDQTVDWSSTGIERAVHPQNCAAPLHGLLHWSRRMGFQVQRPNWEGNPNPLAFQFVPDMVADGVVDLIDSGMVAMWYLIS